MPIYGVKHDGIIYDIEVNNTVWDVTESRLFDVVQIALFSKQDLAYPHVVRFPRNLDEMFDHYDEYTVTAQIPPREKTAREWALETAKRLDEQTRRDLAAVNAKFNLPEPPAWVQLTLPGITLAPIDPTPDEEHRAQIRARRTLAFGQGA